jgi:hypothetical protein
MFSSAIPMKKRPILLNLAHQMKLSQTRRIHASIGCLTDYAKPATNASFHSMCSVGSIIADYVGKSSAILARPILSTVDPYFWWAWSERVKCAITKFQRCQPFPLLECDLYHCDIDHPQVASPVIAFHALRKAKHLDQSWSKCLTLTSSPISIKSVARASVAALRSQGVVRLMTS